MMKKILITGGAGFIGSALCERLLKNNYQITVLDCLSEQIHGEKPESGSPLLKRIIDRVRFVKGSVNDSNLIKKLLPDIDVIVHFAAETGTGQSMYEIHRYNDVNIGGTSIILDYLANEKHNVKKFVIASSRSIYGEGKYYCSEMNAFVYPENRLVQDMDNGDFEVKFNGLPLHLVPTTEDSKIHPSSVYGITKQVQEQLVMTVCPTLGISPVALRYQNVYGPGQSLKNPYTGILSIFSTLILSGENINVFEDGNESRDFVFIEDVVEATYMAITNNAANNQTYNVGSGVPTSVLNVAETLVSNYKSSVQIKVTGNYRVGDIRHNYADISKIKSDLGFSPKYSFDEGIKLFCEWVNEQEIEPSKFNLSIKEMKSKGLLKG